MLCLQDALPAAQLASIPEPVPMSTQSSPQKEVCRCWGFHPDNMQLLPLPSLLHHSPHIVPLLWALYEYIHSLKDQTTAVFELPSCMCHWRSTLATGSSTHSLMKCCVSADAHQ